MYLEIRTALRKATKHDLFTGDLENLKGKQGVKDNVTVFFYDSKRKELTGPQIIYSHHWFREIYTNMVFGLYGVIWENPNITINEFVFDLVLREASIDDLKDTPLHMKLNRMYYTYANKILLGPFFIDRSTTSLYLENLVAKKQIFVPNEKQHFKKREFKKVG